MGIRTTALRMLALCLALAAAPAGDAWAQAGAPPVVPAAPAGVVNANSEYIIGAEDVLDIEVVGQPDKVHARVYTDGTIQMNLVGKLTASGKTTRELGGDIAAALKAGGYYAKPVVNVEVSSFSARYVTVLGAVASPGLVPINRPYRLSEIVARVGGAQERAADYLVIRSADGQEKRYSVDALATGDSSQDPYVQPGDKIYAPMAEVFYISGQVNAPGTFPLKSNMTIRQAIGRASGLTESGSNGKVTVTRGGKRIKLDQGEKVQANDVIVVGERLF